MKAKVKEEEEEEKKRGGDRRQRRQQQQQQRRQQQQQQQRQRQRQRRWRRRGPEWVERLLMGEYFGECRKHGGLRKREENFFCIDCRRKMCFHCLAPHKQKHHKHLQIRKYVYRYVIRVGDLQNLLDLSRIQPYIVNAAKVVHLKPRDKSNPPGGPTCQICRQNVSSNANLFCSVACKVEAEAEVSDDNVEERLEPSSTHDPTPDLDNYGTDKEEEQQQQQQQQQQHQQQQQQQQSYVSGEQNQGSRKQRRKGRKGVPRRAPKF